MTKKYRSHGETLSKSRRTAKTWSKESSERQQYAKKKHWDNEEDAVPRHAVPMNPRLRNIQHKVSLPTDNTFEGWVIDATGRSFIVERIKTVQEEHDAEYEHAHPCYDCVVSRSVVTENPASTLVAVGDYVLCRAEPISGNLALPPAVIVKVEKRRTKLARESAGRDGIEQVIVSNIDQVVVLMSAAEPLYNRRLIDRYLIAAELGDVTPLLCINKIDLLDEAFVREDISLYEKVLGITTFVMSVRQRRGIEELNTALIGKKTVFSGPSGVGKSTLVNVLVGEDVQTVAAVSAKTHKGLHTTTFSKVFRLPNNSYIIDTPGIREFGIWGISKEELSYYFHDFDDFRLQCRFAPCTHTHEPGCAVKSALEQGLIDYERYESYLNIFESLS
ncbi:MAG: ribosome small subunit-dependent GTPase A [Bacteroidota bacterium]|nr:ribosome small subunit-dependent GTPase A [Candidatus Kapabacteria bacterium]MDW8220709.1 ribosome small subunit-dependent GTPase A [Bacteroidota bacterium]